MLACFSCLQITQQMYHGCNPKHCKPNTLPRVLPLIKVLHAMAEWNEDSTAELQLTGITMITQSVDAMQLKWYWHAKRSPIVWWHTRTLYTSHFITLLQVHIGLCAPVQYPVEMNWKRNIFPWSRMLMHVAVFSSTVRYAPSQSPQRPQPTRQQHPVLLRILNINHQQQTICASHLYIDHYALNHLWKMNAAEHHTGFTRAERWCKWRDWLSKVSNYYQTVRAITVTTANFHP